MTVSLSAHNAAGNHPRPDSREDGRAEPSNGPRPAGRARLRQGAPADAEELAAGDSLGVSDPGGSQSALMAL